MKRVLTYDLKYADSNDYSELYNYFKRVGAKQLTESSYLIDSPLSLEEFKTKIRSLTKYGDNVKVISVNTANELFVADIR